MDILPLTKKVCRRCGLSKSTSAFPPYKRNRDGLNSYCRECRNAADKAKPQLRAERNKRFRQNNPEKAAEAGKLWRGKNRPHVRAYNRAAYWDDPEKARARNRRSYQVHIFSRRLDGIAHAAKRRAARGVFTREHAALKYALQEGKCYYCGCQLNNRYEIEHKIPISLGGTNWPANICCACHSCNRSKSNMPFKDFRQLLRQ